MKTYRIKKISGKPDWDSIGTLEIKEEMLVRGSGVRAWGQLCRDDGNLYVHMRAAEKDIRAEYTEPLSPVYEDSALEFFFMIDGYDGYFNLEINPNGCMLLQYGCKERVDLVKRDGREYFDIRTDRTADGWEVFFRLPLRFLQLFWPDFSFDRDLRANMYKCGDRTACRHYLAWSPVEAERPHFHMPEHFGKMMFE